MTTTATTASAAAAIPTSDKQDDKPTSTQVDDLDSQATEVGDDDESVRPRMVASRTVDSAGIVIAFSNLNRSDDSSGRSGDGLQPRGPSRMNGSPGRGTSPPEPCFNTGV